MKKNNNTIPASVATADKLASSEHPGFREELDARIELLEKVKNLFLLPRLDVMTTAQVAEYYNVSSSTITAIVRSTLDELEPDGLMMISAKDVLDSLRSDQHLSIVKTRWGVNVIRQGQTIAIPFRGTYVFPRRAVLRIGMLLGGSRVAREVRPQILNVVEHSSPEQSTRDIQYETALLRDYAEAMIRNDAAGIARATANLMAYKKRHIEELHK